MIVKLSCHIGDWQARSEAVVINDEVLTLGLDELQVMLRKLDDLVREHKGLPSRFKLVLDEYEKMTSSYRSEAAQ